MKQDFLVRRLRRDDITKGYLKSLANLSSVNILDYPLHEIIFDIRTSLSFRSLKSPNLIVPVYNKMVAVFPDEEVFATATLVAELKSIHDGGLVGHIEDVARRTGGKYVGHGAGKACVKELINFGKLVGFYKLVLDCNDRNVEFYEGLGFEKRDNFMRLDLK